MESCAKILPKRLLGCTDVYMRGCQRLCRGCLIKIVFHCAHRSRIEFLTVAGITEFERVSTFNVESHPQRSETLYYCMPCEKPRKKLNGYRPDIVYDDLRALCHTVTSRLPQLRHSRTVCISVITLTTHCSTLDAWCSLQFCSDSLACRQCRENHEDSGKNVVKEFRHYRNSLKRVSKEFL